MYDHPHRLFPAAVKKRAELQKDAVLRVEVYHNTGVSDCNLKPSPPLVAFEAPFTMVQLDSHQVNFTGCENCPLLRLFSGAT